MNLFPFVLQRNSVIPFDPFNSKLKNDIPQAIFQLQESKRRLKQNSLLLSENLLDFNRECDDPKARNIIQNLRRSIFNFRKSDFDYSGILPIDLFSNVIGFYKHLDAYLALKDRVAIQYDSLLFWNRDCLKKIVKNENISTGLMFSSFSLFDSIDKFCESDNSNFKVKDKQRELSLLKYISRSFSKTSPFSSFTRISFFDVRENPLDKTDGSDHSIFLLNNYILRYFLELIYHDKSIFYYIPVKVNPSVVIRDNCFEFLINHNNIEAFQKIESSEVLSLFFEFLSNSENSTSFQDVVDHFSDFFEVDESIAFLKELVDIGFFEWDLNISGRSLNWVLELISFLESIPPGELSTDLLSILFELNLGLDEVSKSGAREKMLLIERSYNLLSAFFERYIKTKRDKDVAGSKVFKREFLNGFFLRKETFFYHDFYSTVSYSPDEKFILQFTNSLHVLLRELAIFNRSIVARLELFNFFNDNFPDQKEVNFLEFYKRYCFLEQESKLNEFRDFGLFESQRKWELGFLSNLSSLNKLNDDIVYLDLQDFRNVNSGIQLDFPLTRDVNSFGAFVQFCHTGSRSQGVVNGTFGGHGKMTSRFLYGFPDHISQLVKEWNNKFNNDSVIFADNSDASFFNANLHPPLLDFEISIPGGHNTVNSDECIPISRLNVEVGDYHCTLIDSESGKKVEILDLGFEAYGSRSKLFIFLQKFVASDLIFPFVLNRILNFSFFDFNNPESYLTVRTLPRIVFDDTVIIQRKSWVFSKKIFPRRSAGVSDFDFFVEIKEWQGSVNVPDFIFVVINSNIIPDSVNTGKSKITRDDRKPQFIDFNNPQFLLLLEKLILKGPEVIVFQEMLPSSDLLPQVGDVKCVSESMIQWYNYE